MSAWDAEVLMLFSALEAHVLKFDRSTVTVLGTLVNTC